MVTSLLKNCYLFFYFFCDFMIQTAKKNYQYNIEICADWVVKILINVTSAVNSAQAPSRHMENPS